ncbi:hypothetical protein OPKNFCMD_6573 [Methylobacterium crusticola]|uniref:HTH lysR-type domain-containing protein n=2 Tax=Methylobacterium crusticola TaxID=1697972 RepID=A0ABQ4R9E6_9HYPH|nr:hypothetical protein OPKNFCMD_6573 [Methylobacterium crusticola]
MSADDRNLRQLEILRAVVRHRTTVAAARELAVSQPAVSGTACVLAAAGVGAAVVDPDSPRQGGHAALVTRPFLPATPAVACMLWSEARPLSRLARAFLEEIGAVSRQAP